MPRPHESTLETPVRSNGVENAMTDGVEPIFDIRRLDYLTGSDPHLNRRLLNEALAVSRQDRLLLCGLINAADRQLLAALAHKVKGGAVMIKAGALLEQCERLEGLCWQRPCPIELRRQGQAMERLMLELEGTLLKALDQ